MLLLLLFVFIVVIVCYGCYCLFIVVIVCHVVNVCLYCCYCCYCLLLLLLFVFIVVIVCIYCCYCLALQTSGKIVTGQNPPSAGPMAEKVVSLVKASLLYLPNCECFVCDRLPIQFKINNLLFVVWNWYFLYGFFGLCAKLK